LQAQADENSELVGKLQASGSLTGLLDVTGVEFGMSTSEPEPAVDNNFQPTTEAEPFDAVINALAWLCHFLAFRRHQDSGAQRQKTNEISPTTRGTESSRKIHS